MFDCGVSTPEELSSLHCPFELATRLEEASVLFDHHWEEVHNRLVVFGADRILVGCLERAVSGSTRRYEIAPICTILNLLYRCSNEHFQDSLAIVGGNLFPPLLATMFLDEVEGVDHNPAVLSLVHKLNCIQVELRDVPWSHSLLESFREVVEKVEPSSNIETLSLMLNWLTDGLLPQMQENKRFLLDNPSFFETLLERFSLTFQPGYETNQAIGKLLKILAFVAVNRSSMVKRMDFFRLLFLLLHDTCPKTQVLVFETLQLAALDKTGRQHILSFLENRIIEKSIEALEVPTLQVPALRLVHVLLSFDDSRERLASSQPALLNQLRSLTKKESQVSLVAAQSLSRLVSTIPVTTTGANILDDILHMCSSENTLIRREGSVSLMKQANSLACAFLMVRSPATHAVLWKTANDEDMKVRLTCKKTIKILCSNRLNMMVLLRTKRNLLSFVQ